MYLVVSILPVCLVTLPYFASVQLTMITCTLHILYKFADLLQLGRICNTFCTSEDKPPRVAPPTDSSTDQFIWAGTVGILGGGATSLIALVKLLVRPLNKYPLFVPYLPSSVSTTQLPSLPGVEQDQESADSVILGTLPAVLPSFCSTKQLLRFGGANKSSSEFDLTIV